MKQDCIADKNKVDFYIEKIEKIFSTKKIVKKKHSKKKINLYYKNSSFGYKYFHSKEGALHMAINYDGVFNEDGYYTQATEISTLINGSTKRVLELGCGKGFNSLYLAKKFPKIKFQGIDITHNHLLIAQKKAEQIENVKFLYGDFHNIEFNPHSFDIVFELESICHSSDHKKVLENVFNILNNNGLFILYEGFRNDNFKIHSKSIKKAAILTEKSMAINKGIEISNWINIAKQVGFKIKYSEDISGAIMPNLCKFQKLALLFFKYKILSNFILIIFPKEMITNSIAGLLMPFTIANKAHVYYKIILEKSDKYK